MIAVPVMVYASNQWPSDAFWHHVHIASQMVEAELTLVNPGTEEIERMVLKSWLEFSYPAGTA